MKTSIPLISILRKCAVALFALLLLNKSVNAQAPVNDDCINAIPLTSGATCTPLAGTANNATPSATTPAPCSGTNRYDVWYSFVAQSPNPVITLGSVGANFITPRIQILTGADCSTLSQVACNTAAVIATTPLSLAVGTTYYIRLYSTNNPVPVTGADFTICITDVTMPANDDCINSVLLTSGVACTPTAGTIMNATPSTTTPAVCNGPVRADVWYHFVAQSPNPVITLGSVGANFTTPRIQILTGADCNSFSQTICNNAATIATTPLNLVVGTTYYIRVYSNNTPIPNANADFTICITDPPMPANDECSTAVPLTPGVACTPTAGTVVNATPSATTPATCSGTNRYDVWYSFVAQCTNPVIQLGSVGAGFNTPRIQILTGPDCNTLTQVACNNAANIATGSLGLIVGTTYYIRVYSTNNPIPNANGDFTICIVNTPMPANDECLNAVTLTSATTCVTYTDSVTNATLSSGIPACGGTAKYDIWYKFVANTTNPTIKLSNVGGNFGGQTPRGQILSGACGSLTSVSCNTFPFTPTGLTVGDTYYLRIYSTTTNPVPNTNAKFDICIQDPLPPANDDCSATTVLIAAAGCSNTAGTLLNAIATAGVPNNCGAAGSPDVWYSFVATGVYPTITLSNVGAQFSSAGPRIQLLSGTCGSFTSLACVSGTSLNTGISPGGVGLIPGNTYYIRVYTNSPVMSGANWNFNICLSETGAPSIDGGKSYLNVTKGPGGGTIEPGDELEIRATVAVRGGTAYNVFFNGIIPTNTTYVPNTLRILTNEGKIYKQWTDAADGDAGTITGSAVTINMGAGASELYGGVVRSSDRPNFGGTCIMVASYRVTVNAVSFGTPISVGDGTYSYSNATGSVTTVHFPSVTAIVYKNYGICANITGSNGILSENGGSFGTGTTKDRIASGNVPANYTYTTFTTGNPADYRYGMSNNTSTGTGPANYSIDPNDPNPTHRVFNVWDIIGDHTGAANPVAGNLPADVNNGQSGGYMVVINASFRTDTAFLDTVRNLCPNTSYEYSAWFRNICPKCGVDSTNTGPATVGYIPTGPGDTSGVHPNLTFNINGYDYYTSGDMAYTGQWVKKGFTYRTGPSETQMIINIRNNAPGGGGNDWAIDDISVATCTPNLNLNPSTPNVNVCFGDGTSLSAEVRSFFDNYTYWVWERSTDNGVTFTNTAFSGNGTVTPVFDGTQYVHTAPGPSFIGDASTNYNIFRLRVASSAGNLVDPNCSFVAARTVQVFVNNCMDLLATRLTPLYGKLNNKLATLQWTTQHETTGIVFDIERSTDGTHFQKIATVNATGGEGGNASYSFKDMEPVTGATYYRIKLVHNNSFVYSNVVLLDIEHTRFEVKALVNPFDNYVSFTVITPADKEATILLFDSYGRQVLQQKKALLKGLNKIVLPDLGNLSDGNYILRIEAGANIVNKKLVKHSH